MKLKKIILLSIAALLLASPLTRAQNVRDLIISEAAIGGAEDGIVDEYGQKSGWIELFNLSQGTVNYAGCFLSDDRNDLKKNVISKSDSRTKLGPRQSVIFHASGDGSQGTFYVCFQLCPGKTLYLTSNDGRTIIDSLQIPDNLPAGKSVSKIATDNKQMKFFTAKEFTEPTPGMMNGVVTEESNSQKMERQDPYGLILTIVSVSVVFASLAILWFLFSTLFSNRKKKEAGQKNARKIGKGKAGDQPDAETAIAISMALEEEFGGEIYAAIGMALHQYQNETVHDQESFIITIQPSQTSNWNDKTQNFRRKPTR